ncbi:MAG: phosphotyrosine protein phosphatase [Nitrospirota bacterium]
MNMKVLFVCTENRMRSPTAEKVFRDYPGVEARSAGIGFTSENYVEAHLIRWADIIFVMEKRHREYIRNKFKDDCEGRRIICLGIPDEYNYMDYDLVDLLKDRVTPYLKGSKISGED